MAPISDARRYFIKINKTGIKQHFKLKITNIEK